MSQEENFDNYPDEGFVREWQIVPSNKRRAHSVPLPFSHSTLWRLVKAGKFPTPTKLSQNITAWKVGDVRKWISKQAEICKVGKASIQKKGVSRP